mgnify:CR=1 FL=1
MAAPAFAIYSFLYLYPALTNLLYATQRWDGVTTPEFVGLKNFQNLLTNDDLFLKILGNNVRFSLIVVIFQTGFALLFATFLLKNTKTNIFLRTVYFFPTILSVLLIIYFSNYRGICSSIFKVFCSKLVSSCLESFPDALRLQTIPNTLFVLLYQTMVRV